MRVQPIALTVKLTERNSNRQASRHWVINTQAPQHSLRSLVYSNGVTIQNLQCNDLVLREAGLRQVTCIVHERQLRLYVARRPAEDPAHRILVSRSEWLNHAEGAPTRFMVVSGGVLCEGYGYDGPGVCLGGGQTEAYLRDMSMTNLTSAWASSCAIELLVVGINYVLPRDVYQSLDFTESQDLQ